MIIFSFWRLIIRRCDILDTFWTLRSFISWFRSLISISYVVCGLSSHSLGSLWSLNSLITFLRLYNVSVLIILLWILLVLFEWWMLFTYLFLLSVFIWFLFQFGLVLSWLLIMKIVLNILEDVFVNFQLIFMIVKEILLALTDPILFRYHIKISCLWISEFLIFFEMRLLKSMSIPF